MLSVWLFQAVLALLGAYQAHAADYSFVSSKKSMGGLGYASNNPAAKSWDRPYFDDVSPRNITAIVGQTAELNCHVKNLGNRTISWIRQRDIHILTSSIHTYTGDGRFSVSHPESSDAWKLKIAYVNARDAGVYECQINTAPKLNLEFALRVEASALLPATTPIAIHRILDSAAQAVINPPDVHVKKGSTISLVCTVNVHSTPPSSVAWHHGTSLVDFDSPRGGVSLETEKTENGTTSRLMLTQARLSDSGNYTCIPSNANPATVTVHVLNGEHPAAMQHGGSADKRLTGSTLLLSGLLTTLLSGYAGLLLAT